MKQKKQNKNDQIIGRNIARIRLETGLSQADMEEFGISRAYYGRIELGLHSLTVDKLVLIARALGVPVSELFLNENKEELL